LKIIGATGNVTLNYRSRKACEAPKQKEKKYPIRICVRDTYPTNIPVRVRDVYPTNIPVGYVSRTRMTTIERS
jgi:hypothetical protein